MKIRIETTLSGRAVGKQIVIVDGYGSFHPMYVQLYELGIQTLYLCHSKKEHETKLCHCLLDVANHLGIDCDEMVNSLPNNWDKEFTSS